MLGAGASVPQTSKSGSQKYSTPYRLDHAIPLPVVVVVVELELVVVVELELELEELEELVEVELVLELELVVEDEVVEVDGVDDVEVVVDVEVVEVVDEVLVWVVVVLVWDEYGELAEATEANMVARTATATMLKICPFLSSRIFGCPMKMMSLLFKQAKQNLFFSQAKSVQSVAGRL